MVKNRFSELFAFYTLYIYIYIYIYIIRKDCPAIRDLLLLHRAVAKRFRIAHPSARQCMKFLVEVLVEGLVDVLIEVRVEVGVGVLVEGLADVLADGLVEPQIQNDTRRGDSMP